MPALGTAPGVPQLSGKTIPEIWSTNLLVKFYEATVFNAIANSDWEGDIQAMGDTVHIQTTPDITINDYVKGQELDYENPDPGQVDLFIDKAKSWSFVVNNVDKFQSNFDIQDDWARDGSESMKIAIDTDILANVYADVAAANTGATAGKISQDIDLGAVGAPIALSKTNIIDEITKWGQILDEQDVPEGDRWAVIPAWAAQRIKTSDLREVQISGDETSIVRNGRLGMIDKFTIYSSNLIDTATDGADKVYNMIFGHKSALTFASSLVEHDTIANPKGFGVLNRGLPVYGYKTVKDTAMGHVYAKQA